MDRIFKIGLLSLVWQWGFWSVARNFLEGASKSSKMSATKKILCCETAKTVNLGFF